MKDYFITPSQAKKKLSRVRAAGIVLGISPSFTDVDSFSPFGAKEYGKYLKRFGIKNFSVSEVITPRDKRKARSVGFKEFISPAHLWPWTVVVLKLGELMREAVKKPIKCRNLYRPFPYNKLVAKSGIESDHPNACGGDFDFPTSNDRRIAEAVIRTWARVNPLLEMSMGAGKKTLHVGALSPKGSRTWFYDSYPDKRIKLPKVRKSGS